METQSWHFGVMTVPEGSVHHRTHCRFDLWPLPTLPPCHDVSPHLSSIHMWIKVVQTHSESSPSPQVIPGAHFPLGNIITSESFLHHSEFLWLNVKTDTTLGNNTNRIWMAEVTLHRADLTAGDCCNYRHHDCKMNHNSADVQHDAL